MRFSGITLLIFSAIIGFSLFPLQNNLEAYHDSEEMERFKIFFGAHMVDTTNFFATSSLCESCHGEDDQGINLVDANGNDVSMYSRWSATMMANSAKDPFWRAKVSHETLINPTHSEALETKCTSCHAPLGNYRAALLGAESYSIAEMVNDSFGLDGVSCGACHHMSDEKLGKTFSGEISFDTSRVTYGPHLFPFEQSMLNFVGMRPVYSEHILDAGICAPCHTLITESVDLSGEPTGTSFVEQATYHEWLNSRYNTEDVSCQGCHMPVLEESVTIADDQPNLIGRTPYGVHELVGANTYMLELMKDHKDTLGITASAVNYDSTIQSTYKILQEQSIDSYVDYLSTVDDTAYFKVRVENKAGHKFPSGYPSRRAHIEFQVFDNVNNSIFHSGAMDASYAVMNQDDPFEPHYDEITSADQVQIYELVNGDVNGNFSTVLERGFARLKDNRLVPQGFSKTHSTYDTTTIIGLANDDPNFNFDNGLEGSGTDEIIYKVALNNYSGIVSVNVKVLYQSLPPHWMEEMFNESTPEIEFFKAMYEAKDPVPVLVDENELMDIFVGTSNIQHPLAALNLSLYPNPSSGLFNLEGDISKIKKIQLMDINGQLIKIFDEINTELFLPNQSGIYLLLVELKDGSSAVERIIRL